MSDFLVKQILHLNCIFKSVTLNLFLGCQESFCGAKEDRETKIGIMTAAASTE